MRATVTRAATSQSDVGELRDRSLVDRLQLLAENELLLLVHLHLAKAGELHAVGRLLAGCDQIADAHDDLAGEHRVPDEAFGDRAGADIFGTLAGREG